MAIILSLQCLPNCQKLSFWWACVLLCQASHPCEPRISNIDAPCLPCSAGAQQQLAEFYAEVAEEKALLQTISARAGSDDLEYLLMESYLEKLDAAEEIGDGWQGLLTGMGRRLSHAQRQVQAGEGFKDSLKPNAALRLHINNNKQQQGTSLNPSLSATPGEAAMSAGRGESAQEQEQQQQEQQLQGGIAAASGDAAAGAASSEQQAQSDNQQQQQQLQQEDLQQKPGKKQKQFKPAGSSRGNRKSMDKGLAKPRRAAAAAPTLSAGKAAYSTAISVGNSHYCGILSNGKLMCAGDNSSGQSNPPSLPDGVKWTSVSCGELHCCAIAQGGSLRCWGKGDTGQLKVPELAGGARWSQVSAGAYHSCGITTNKELVCWGAEGVSDRQEVVPSGGKWVGVSAGVTDTCGIQTRTGKAKCW